MKKHKLQDPKKRREIVADELQAGLREGQTGYVPDDQSHQQTPQEDELGLSHPPTDRGERSARCYQNAQTFP